MIGAGFMGAGIAYVAAKAGIEVVLVDRDQEAADKGKAHSASLMEGLVKKGRAKPEEAEALLARIQATPDYAALSDADLVIEAVFEDRDVKAEVSRRVAEVLKPDAIFASNTSTLPITSLAEAFPDASRFVGIHFFSPVDKMMLTEVILGKETGDKALAVALDFVRAIKKTPIVVNDTRGFFANRCVLRYMTEAYDMLVEGVPPAMIENAAKFAGMPVGPLALNDETAVDLSQKIMKATIRDMGEGAIDPRHFALVNEMVDGEGRLGRKAGKGFYDYPAKPAKKHLWPGLKDKFPQQKADAVDFEELKQRFLVTMALEAARTWRKASSPTRARRCRLDPRLRLRALYRRHAELHRRHGREELRGALRAACREARRAVPPDASPEGDGGERRELLFALRPGQGRRLNRKACEGVRPPRASRARASGRSCRPRARPVRPAACRARPSCPSRSGAPSRRSPRRRR